jgi:hypothetical protein
MQKHYPHVKTYVRAHDVNHGINLEKAGATVVVPEILEPSLQLAASVLSEFELPYDEVTNVLDQFRKKHLSELQVLAASTGEPGGGGVPRGGRGGAGTSQGAPRLGQKADAKLLQLLCLRGDCLGEPIGYVNGSGISCLMTLCLCIVYKHIGVVAYRGS